MQDCRVMISTKTDGESNEICRDGEMEIFPRAANLIYHEENAVVKVSLHDGRAEVVREGDYTLSLFLENGRKTQGTLGIGGNVGEITTQTLAVEYKIAEDFVAAHLRYDLILGAERQKMELRLLATKK